LVDISAPDLLEELFVTARQVKEHIYGKRLVIFAPLYISNMCANECVYCAFRARNKEVKRRALTQDEIASETKALIDQGHKRVLLVAGESYPKEGFDYILKSIDTVYSVKHDKGEIRRLNVNIAPLSVDEFRRLKEHNIGTYQIFQETYHHETYKKVHLAGKKADYDWRIGSVDRAMEAGIDDVGIGVLFGLFDWRFEILAMLQHIRHLEQRFGVGPHTLSVPRLEPAIGSDIASHPPHPISDIDFRKVVAILRLAVPYTGIIMSTRESANIRRETFALGVSQISAGSRTNPGGYGSDERFEEAQFCFG
jgi:2-iminoacetate synthase